MARGQELSAAKLPLDKVWGTAFSPDGKLLACGGGDGTVRLWDLSRGKEVRVLTVDDNQRRGRDTTAVHAMVFSPDGLRLAAAAMQTVKIWDMLTLQELYTIAPAGVAGDLAFSPDGAWLLGVGNDAAVQAGDTPEGSSLRTFRIGIDNTAVLWDGRPLTPEREVEREALGLLDQLFSRPLPRKDVLEHLHAAALAEPVRQAALRLAAHYQEEADPKRYAGTARTLARSAHLLAAWHRQALSQAEAACARAGGDGYCLTTLGMAQYRLGKYAEALQTLTKADERNARELKGSAPADLAFLALVHHRLGHENEVCDILVRLHQRMQDGRWKGDEEAGVLLHEAELRINGTMTPWPPVEGAKTAPAEKPKR